MTRIQEVPLPGIGVRHEFTTRAGDHLGVITHRTGRRDLLVYDRKDPDACRETIRLDEDDSRTLAELLGGAQVEEGSGPRRYEADNGIVFDWVPVSIASACAGHTLAEAVRPAGDGAGVAAIMRGGRTIAAPPPDLRVEIGDVAVLVGTAEGIRDLVNALQRG